MKAYSHLSAEERARIDELRNRDGLGVRQIALQWNKYTNPGNTTVTPTPAPTPQPSRPSTGGGYSVMVRSGDTISGIAARIGLWPVTA